MGGLTTTLLLAVLIRLVLVFYGLWQDANMVVKYTDIDYVVFTDAARYMTQGEAPYLRATYRYTPLLAWMLQINIWSHPAAGKLLFILADIVAGLLVYLITGSMLKSHREVKYGQEPQHDCDYVHREGHILDSGKINSKLYKSEQKWYSGQDRSSGKIEGEGQSNLDINNSSCRQNTVTADESLGTRSRMSPLLCCQVYLFNPLLMTISTRGNAESLVAVLLMVTMYSLCLCRTGKASPGWLMLGGLSFGIVVHMRIYPFIYALPIYLYINWCQSTRSIVDSNVRDVNKVNISKSSGNRGYTSVLHEETSDAKHRKSNTLTENMNMETENLSSTMYKPHEQSEHSKEDLKFKLSENFHSSFLHYMIPKCDALIFAFSAAIAFLAITGIFYLQYGHQFIHETYLYHLTRRDHRHNFSPYFYFLYLFGASQPISGADTIIAPVIVSLASFLPQMALLCVIALRMYRWVEMSCFCLTFVFVMLNKVCTSQYFCWYLSLLPLILPNLRLSLSKALFLTTIWISSQGLWLGSAYLLEFQAQNTFLQIWVSSLVFLLCNTFILHHIIQHYCPPHCDRTVTPLYHTTDMMNPNKRD